jgi:hypothetical protein
MVAIEIRSWWDSICISIPDRASVVGGIEHEWICVLSESVKTRVVREMSPKAHILALEDQRRGTGVEENLVASCAFDGEAEGFVWPGVSV